MRVLIAGGTGFIGAALASELVERGHDVVSLSRTPDDSALPAGVSTVAADVTDPEAVSTAVEGADAVVNLVALSPLFQPSGGDGRHRVVHLGGTENLVAAARDHGVAKFVQLSALGADPDGSTHYVRAKGQAETVVRESDLDWTVVRPSVVFGEGGEFVAFTKTLTTPYVTGLPGGGNTRFQPIWVGDLVPMLTDAVEGDEHVGATYEIGGPDVMTLADVSRVIYRASGKSLVVLSVPMALARVGLSVGDRIPGFPMGRDQYRSLQFDNTVADNDVDAFEVDETELRPFADYLNESGRNGTPGLLGRARAVLLDRLVLVIFAFLTLAWSLQYVVDIYVHPLVR